MTTLRFETHPGPSEFAALDLPIEVRKPDLVLVTRHLASESADIDPGQYYASALLPDGQELSGQVHVLADSDALVILTPDRVNLSSDTRAVDNEARSTYDSIGLRLFVGSERSSGYQAVSQPGTEISERETNSLILSGQQESVLLLQMFQLGHPPLNIAIPASPERTCRIQFPRAANQSRTIDVQLDNPTANGLLRYMESGLFDRAGALMDSPSLRAELLVRDKQRDPFAAVVGAYALLRLGHIERLHDWTANLQNWFNWLPDTHLIRGEHLARLGRHNEALASFLRFPSRLLPVFTDGFSYTLDRLRLYTSARNAGLDETQLREADRTLRTFQRYIPYVNFQRSILTFTGQHPNKPGANPTKGISVATPSRTVLNFIPPSVQLNDTDRARAIEYGEYNNRGASSQNAGHFEEALNYYNRAIEIAPWIAIAYSNRGITNQKIGNYDEAIADYTQAIALDASLSTAYHNRGTVYEILQRDREALSDFNQAIDLNPVHSWIYINRGHVLTKLGRDQEALANYTKAIELNPLDMLAHYNRGTTYMRLNHFQEAIEDLLQAIALESNYAPAHANLGAAYVRLNRDDQARAKLAQALELNGSLAPVYFNLAVLCEDSHQYDEAVELFSRAISLDPSFVPSYSKRGVIFHVLGQNEAAISDFTEALKWAPNDAVSYYNRANVYSDRELHVEALEDLTMAIKLDPDFTAAYNNRGGILYRLSRRDDALADFTRFIELDHHSTLGYKNRAAVLMELDRYADALDDLAQAVELDRGDPQIYSHRGALYHRMQRFNDAIESFNISIELHALNAEAYMNRGITHGVVENYEASLRDLTTAIGLDPSLAAAYANRAVSEVHLGLLDLAKQDYDLAIELEPSRDFTAIGDFIAQASSGRGGVQQEADTTGTSASRRDEFGESGAVVRFTYQQPLLLAIFVSVQSPKVVASVGSAMAA